MRGLRLRPRPSAQAQPLFVSAAPAVAVRGMNIKRYVPARRRRELELLGRCPELHLARCQLFRERGAGGIPTIVLGGFVPDATETVEFQRDILRRYGSIYYLNYPRAAFRREMFAAQLSDLIEGLAQRGQRPVIFCVSFGCGLLLDFLSRSEGSLDSAIRGLLLVSPVLCTPDLVRQEQGGRGGVRMLEHNLKKILAADQNDPEQVARLIERSRRCFHALFSGGAEQRSLGERHRSISGRVFEVIQGTTADGGFQRVMALRDFAVPETTRPLFTGPVLTLLAEDEEQMLVPSSPALRLSRNPELQRRIFPDGEVRTVRSLDPDDGVPHASLIFHHDRYNAQIEGWYERRVSGRLEMAV